MAESVQKNNGIFEGRVSASRTDGTRTTGIVFYVGDREVKIAVPLGVCVREGDEVVFGFKDEDVSRANGAILDLGRLVRDDGFVKANASYIFTLRRKGEPYFGIDSEGIRCLTNLRISQGRASGPQDYARSVLDRTERPEDSYLIETLFSGRSPI